MVARKKGLDDHYVPADGSPRPKPANKVVEPVRAMFCIFRFHLRMSDLQAPGTFGFDHSKYRGWNENRTEEIPMDEFGQRIDDLARTDNEQRPEPTSQVVDKEPEPQSPLTPPARQTGSISPARAESPAPFSQYSAPTPIPEIRVTRASSDHQPKVEVRVEDESGGGGCCKCVIM